MSHIKSHYRVVLCRWRYSDVQCSLWACVFVYMRKCGKEGVPFLLAESMYACTRVCVQSHCVSHCSFQWQPCWFYRPARWPMPLTPMMKSQGPGYGCRPLLGIGKGSQTHLTKTWPNYQWLCVCVYQCFSGSQFGSLSSKALWSTPTLATSPPLLTGVPL